MGGVRPRVYENAHGIGALHYGEWAEWLFESMSCVRNARYYQIVDTENPKGIWNLR